MPSLIMESEQQTIQNVMEDGLGRDLMDAGRFCFNCEQIFSERMSLEQHVCPASTHICSCGTEFTHYPDMLDHSTTHEPGHQVLDHETIRKRRIEKLIAEEEQLKRLQIGDVIWEAPKLNSVASKPLVVKPRPQVPIQSAHKPQVSMQSANIAQVPQLYPSASLPQYSINSAEGVKNFFAGTGAPTVDLWTLYQPVVLLKTSRQFNRTMPYGCGKCGQCFSSKTSLISHHSCHATDKVSGCVGCGLLLSSKKVVPRFHFCSSPNNGNKFRLITARLQGFKVSKEPSTESNKLSAQGSQASTSIQLKREDPSATIKGIHRPGVLSNLQFKHQDIRKCQQGDQGRHVALSLPRVWSPRTSKLLNTVSFPSKNQSTSLSASKKNGQWIPNSMRAKKPTHHASAVSGKPAQMSSASNGFNCRVCHLPFESAQLLQRHKCIRAREFMAQHGPGGRQQYRIKTVTPVTNPVPIQMNGERRFQVPADGNLKRKQVVTIDLDREQDAVPVNKKTGVVMDDDCYIVESGPNKPAEMIYQVTSSVPIKT